MKYLLIAFGFTCLLMAALLYGLFAVLGQDLPTPARQQDVEPRLATRVLDRNGELIDELYVEARVPIRIGQVPPAFLDAIIAIEDRRFYQHWGIDPIGILRAATKDLIRGERRQGASTITQQLARNIFLHHRRTWSRKIREAILALRIERAFSKDEILDLYLNKIYFGEGAYGLEAASRRFFGKPARELALEEAALLAGIPGNPALFSPRRHPETSLRRRNLVLRAMLETGAIDEATYAEIRERPIVLREHVAEEKQGSYFTEAIRRELINTYEVTGLYHDGLTVKTTLDLDLQRVAERILEETLRQIEERNRYPYLSGAGDSMLAAYGHAPGVENPTPLRLQGALVAIEPSTGAIRALVGGRSFAESPWNRASQMRRQPASAFKPMIYAEAIRQGYRTTDILLDTPVEFEVIGTTPEECTWAVHNFSETYRGPVTLRSALMHSINVPTAKLLDAIGVRSVVALTKRLGVESPIPAVLSLATGTGELTLLEMTGAYAVFANQGIRVEPFGVERVLDRQGHVLETHLPQSEQALDPQTSYIVTHMMKSVFDGGTGQTARSIYDYRSPAAGKTGTNDDYTDAWFVGFTTDLALGVWVGFDLSMPIGDKRTGTGAMAALPVWARVMKDYESRYGKPRDFNPPEGLVFAETCLETGLLAGPNCPDVIEDVFIAGTAPQQICRTHDEPSKPGRDFRRLDHQLYPREDWIDQAGQP